MKIFLTGGAGYIGSHSLLAVLKAGHEAMVYDNFSNSSPEALKRVKRLANRDFEIVEGDIRDHAALEAAMKDFRPDVVIHFAGLKAVGESVEKPLQYYDNNVNGSVVLLDAMSAVNCPAIVFSSSATVYGEPEYLPYDEAHPLRPESPYGRTKLMVENIIADWVQVDERRASVILRYFNPVGAHESGDIGEDPFDIPNNLMPFVQQVAVGRRDKLTIHGDDYPTRDGTGVRDFIHIEDLAEAHILAAEYAHRHFGTEILNIGTGQGRSVKEVIESFERTSGQSIAFEIGPRRAGDIAEFYASNDRARAILGWEAKLDLDDMTRTAWNFQKQNPKGYES